MKRDSFVQYIFDQLRELGDVRCRRMFGGYGLYRGDKFFGIIHADCLYFKTDPITAPLYRERGMEPFRPNAKQTLRNYYEVPAEVLDDAEELAVWAQRALRMVSRNG